MLSHVQLVAIPWALAHHARLSMGFPRQKYWGGLPFPSPGNLSNPGFEPMCPESPALESGFFITEPPGKPSDDLIYASNSGCECTLISSFSLHTVL